VWHLAEGQGSQARDSSRNGNHGTYDPSATLAQTGGFGDLAVRFDGSTTHVDLGGLDVAGARGPDGITLEAYAWPEGSLGDARLLSKADGASDSNHWWMLSLNNGNRLRFRLKTDIGGTSTLIANSGDVAHETWLYGVATYEGTSMRLYLDGQQVDSEPKTGAVVTNAGKSAWIGSNPGGYGFWRGFIGEVRLSSIGRSSDWIRGQARAFSGVFVTMTDPEIR
jgi:hypothetical protein